MKRTRYWKVRIGSGYEDDEGEFEEDAPTEIIEQGWHIEGYEDEIFISLFIPDTIDSNELDN